MTAAVAIVSVLVVGAAASGSGGAGRTGELNLVAYSTPRDLYEGTLEPHFAATAAGEGTGFRNSFGSSGEQTRGVEVGQPADLIHLSLGTDMIRLAEAGIVAPDWNRNRYDGILQNSVVVLVVREGNPKRITGWQDLTRDDVEVVSPNPFTSGGARWNVMAMYGSQVERGSSHRQALAFVERVMGNIEVQDKSASEALLTFLGGKGDVLVSYENEAVRAVHADEPVEYVVPRETILIETPVAVSEEADNPRLARAFLDYLYGKRAQSAFARAGYRPVVPSVAERFRADFPKPHRLFTIADFGGWEKVSTEFFDPDTGSIAEINQQLGQATG